MDRSEHKKIIAVNTLWQIIGRIVTTGASFVVIIVLARSYAVATLGTFVTITTLVSFCSVLTDFGLNATYLKRDARYAQFRSFLWLRILLSLVLIIVLTLLISIGFVFNTVFFGITPPLFLGMGVFSLTLVTQSLVTTYAALFQGTSQYHKQSIALFAGSLLLLLSIIPFSYFHLPLVFVFMAYLFSGVLSASLTIILAKYSPFPYQVDWRFLKPLLRQGLPLGFLLIFNLLYFRIDTLLLSAIKGTDAVGIYGYAYKYFDFTLTIPLFLSNSLYPFLLRNQKNVRKGELNEQEFFLIFLGIGVLGAIVGIVMSPLIALISPQYQSSVVVLRILLSSLPFFFLTSYLQWVLIARNMEQALVSIYIGAAVLNIVLNLIFIPYYSYIAASVTTGVCEVIVFLLLLRVHFTKNLRNRP